MSEDRDPTFYPRLAQTENRRFIPIRVYDHSDTTEAHYFDTGLLDARPILIEARERRLTHNVSEWCGRFRIRANADGAEDFKIVQTPVDSPGWESRAEPNPYRLDRQILDMSVYEDQLV